MAELPSTASVVVIGGGVMGLSAAYHLARAGVADVLLLERDDLGSGSTCKAAGGVRAQFSDPVNIELGQRSLRAYERFGDELGQEIDLHRSGYLFLLDDPDHVAAFEANVALQNSLGVPSRMITPAEAGALSPMVRLDGVLAAAWSPEDGHCTPESVVLGYAGGARRAGARIVTHCAGHRDRGRRTARSAPCSPTPVGSTPTRSSAPPAPGRARWGRWSASTCPSYRCGARS